MYEKIYIHETTKKKKKHLCNVNISKLEPKIPKLNYYSLAWKKHDIAKLKTNVFGLTIRTI